MGTSRRRPVFMLRLQGASGLLLNFLGLTELRWFLPRRLIRWYEVQRVVWDEAGARVETTQGLVRLPMTLPGWRELGEAIAERIGQDQFAAAGAVAIPAAVAEAWLEVGPGGERRRRLAAGSLPAALAVVFGTSLLVLLEGLSRGGAARWGLFVAGATGFLMLAAYALLRLAEQNGWLGQKATADGLERWLGPWRQLFPWTSIRDVRQQGENVVVQTDRGRLSLGKVERQILNALNRAAASNRSGRVQDDVDLSPGAVSLARGEPDLSAAALSRTAAAQERLGADRSTVEPTQDVTPPAS